jgi:translation initiation factor 1 (eIF-1/SUI1)
LKECYQVVHVDQGEIIKTRVRTFKGSVPKVLVKAHRVQNKKQTVISGLELFQVDYDDLVPYFATKCASSATLHEIESRKDCYTV